jgi:esterase/lipase superfamily enzyme
MTRPGTAFRWFGPVLAAGMLAGCAIPYGPIEHRLYAADPPCNPAPGTAVPDAAALPMFVVTSRLADCRAAPLRLLPFRADQPRFGRFAPPLEATLNDDGKRPPALAFQHGEDWWRALGSAAAGNKGRVFLYVHGYREGFATVARDSGQIARMTGFGGPVIAYSWPSQAKLGGYGADVANVSWDQENFGQFLARLVETEAVTEVVVMAHSLGSRLVMPGIEYSDRTAPQSAAKLKTIILASPDFDREEFDRAAARDLLNEAKIRAGRRIHIYASARDRALDTSRQINGLPRLGRPDCYNPKDPLALPNTNDKPRCYANPRALAGPETVQALTIIDSSAVTRGASGHSDFLRSAVVCRDLTALISGNSSAMVRAATQLPHVFLLAEAGKQSDETDKTACRIGG